MRVGLTLARGIGAISLSAAVVAACASGGGEDGSKSGLNGSVANGTGGSLVIGNPSGGMGGSIAINDPATGNPVLTTCEKTTDCAAGDVCVLTEGGGFCSPNGGTCTAAGNECVNDTYCCL